jgi:transcriptional regulator with XRE-family HTH domain
MKRSSSEASARVGEGQDKNPEPGRNMAVEIEPTGRFGTALRSAMDAKSVSAKELADRVKITYEHVRKLIRGDAYPSKSLLTLICQTLEWDSDKATQLAHTDKIERKFGGVPALLAGKNPELSDIERHWEYLHDEQKETVKVLVAALADRNRTSV